MRHAILGAGGVGGLIGAILAKAGDEVILVLRPETLQNYPAEISVQSPLGSISVAVGRASQITQGVDVLWIAVKATQLDAALKNVITKPEAIGAVVPLLNGIDHVSLLRARFGHDRVVPASIAVETERVAPGKIVQSSPSARMTVSANGEDRLTPTIEKLRQFGFNCQFNPDEQKILWTKLAFLGPFALTTTASGLTAGEIRNDPAWRNRLETAFGEACAVGTASGTPLQPAMFIKFFDSIPAGGRSSMQKDVAAGNPPELDAIGGPILRGAQEHHIEVPVTSELVRLIRGKSTAASQS
jgi:2-dehydropantoate 2-reductase